MTYREQFAKLGYTVEWDNGKYTVHNVKTQHKLTGRDLEHILAYIVGSWSRT